MMDGTPTEELSGQQLDGEVARRVMAWREESQVGDLVWWTDGAGERVRPQDAWHPSRVYAQAWEVQKNLQAKGWSLSIESRPSLVSEADRASEPPWEATFFQPRRQREVSATGASASEAICRAALRAVGGGE